MRGTSTALEPLSFAHMPEKAEQHPLQLLLAWQLASRNGSKQVVGAATCKAMQQPEYGAWSAASSMPGVRMEFLLAWKPIFSQDSKQGAGRALQDIGWALLW